MRKITVPIVAAAVSIAIFYHGSFVSAATLQASICGISFQQPKFFAGKPGQLYADAQQSGFCAFNWDNSSWRVIILEEKKLQPLTPQQEDESPMIYQDYRPYVKALKNFFKTKKVKDIPSINEMVSSNIGRIVKFLKDGKQKINGVIYTQEACQAGTDLDSCTRSYVIVKANAGRIIYAEHLSYRNESMNVKKRNQEAKEIEKMIAKIGDPVMKEYLYKYNNKKIFSFSYPADYALTANEALVDEKKKCYVGPLEGIGLEFIGGIEKVVASKPVKIKTVDFGDMVKVNVVPFVKNPETEIDYVGSWAMDFMNLAHVGNSLIPSELEKKSEITPAVSGACRKDFEKMVASLRFHTKKVEVK